jgi:hypothetical protein
MKLLLTQLNVALTTAVSTAVLVLTLRLLGVLS